MRCSCILYSSSRSPEIQVTTLKIRKLHTKYWRCTLLIKSPFSELHILTKTKFVVTVGWKPFWNSLKNHYLWVAFYVNFSCTEWSCSLLTLVCIINKMFIWIVVYVPALQLHWLTAISNHKIMSKSTTKEWNSVKWTMGVNWKIWWQQTIWFGDFVNAVPYQQSTLWLFGKNDSVIYYIPLREIIKNNYFFFDISSRVKVKAPTPWKCFTSFEFFKVL